jgi:three-Cys-motif partner protein
MVEPTLTSCPNFGDHLICGAGIHISKKDKTKIEGSPWRALKVQPPFDGFHFIDVDAEKTKFLRESIGNRADVNIQTVDTNQYLTQTLLPTIQYAKYNRALCLLDPYGLDLDWQVMLQAGQSKAIDMFLNFPVMDINRNAIWKNPEKVPPDGVERMTKYWGDESWKQAAYTDSPQQNLFGEPPGKIKQGNEVIVATFRERLKTVAGFEFVPEPLPMKNTKNAVVYYLFFASAKPVAAKIITEIFEKYR